MNQSQLKETQSRIPQDLKAEGWTWFSKRDVWVYHMVSDDRLCDQCRLYAEIEYWGGEQLRGTFPWLLIESQDLITVNAHPNCRCYLMRLFV